eukprot:jgi/Orpsp1_1/1190115/evm.model.d7180000076654.2
MENDNMFEEYEKILSFIKNEGLLKCIRNKKILNKANDFEKLNEQDINICLYIAAIDLQNLEAIKILENEKTDKEDIISEIFNRGFLNPDRIQFITKIDTGSLRVSSTLIKNLIKNKKGFILDVIFETFKFYTNDLIKNLLFYYKNKKPLSSFELNQQISKEDYKILVKETIKVNIKNYDNSCTPFLYQEDKYNLNKYLINACIKNKEHLVKYLVKHGVNVNGKDRNNNIPLFIACKHGNENIIKYLIIACKNGN